jgi:4-amino-4-deoxy-L-arabinose transferase-like glycosyltransferase
MSRVAWPIVLAFTAIKLAVHLYASDSYSWFRDELYFLACSRHLDWGYVDHPPLIAIVAWIGDHLGDSLRAFRLPVTIAGAVRVLLTGVLTARMGGGRVAQALACAAVLCSSMYLGMDSILTMNTFEHIFWLVCILAVVEIVNGGSEKWWLVFGVAAGLALQTKISVLFLAFAIGVAILLTPLRRSLLRPWIWVGAAIALVIFLPNLVWQMQRDFPTLELLRNVKETGKNVVLPFVPFAVQQVMMLNPFMAPVWIAGLVWLFGSRYRVLAFTYVVLFATFFWFEAKDYYVAPIYPMLFAAGAVWLSRRRWTFIPAFALMLIGGLIAAPLVLPIFPPQQYIAYQQAIGAEQQQTEVSHTAAWPQLFADQMGWEEMVREVARIYHALPPEQRAKTAIYGSNYGQAAAIDFYGPKYGLPRAISGHQNYYLWGPREYTGESMIVIASAIVRTRPLYDRIEVVGKRFHPYGIPDENGPVFLCRTKRPLREIWGNYKNWR